MSLRHDLLKIQAVLTSLFLLFALAQGAEAELQHVRIERGIMGTSLQIDLYGPDTEILERAADAAVVEMERIEDMMTTWHPSPLTALNEAAGMGPRQVPAELAQIIGRAKALHEATGGAFDISFYSAGKLWDFKASDPKVPDADAIHAALINIDASRIGVDPATGQIDLPTGMAIDLGGIAKGYGVDRAMSVIMEHGVEHAMVNAGGDLKALGLNGNEPWELAVKHPRNASRALASIRLSNQCLVTSGDYERFFKQDGRVYHHIFDPRTAMPATGCISVSVLGYNAELADALATACCVLGPDKGKNLINSFPRIEAVFVGMNGEVTMTDGISPAPQTSTGETP